MNKDIQVTFDKLCEHLDELIKSYRVLLDQVRREKQHLIQVELEELNVINKEKATLLSRIQHTEKLRTKVAGSLATAIGADEEPIRLTEIAKKLPKEESEKIRSLHSTLDLLLKRIVEINKDNALLAENALQCASGVIGDIKNSLYGPAKPTYERRGKMSAGGGDKSGNLVSREA